MTLYRISGEIFFECDTCSDELETCTKDFDEARQALKDANWKSKKKGDDWEHECPDCQDEEGGADDFEDIS